MKISLKKGFSFGLTSAIITTLGLIIGLYSSTQSRIIIISGILIIAIADALSDALGMHISEESEGKHTQKEVWTATFATFTSKFIFALTFIVPILLLNLLYAIIVSIIWGLLLISIASYYIAESNKMKHHKVIIEHLMISIFVIIITYAVGSFFSM